MSDVNFDNGCDFCRIVSGAEPARFVMRDGSVTAFMPSVPATPGHTLVIPNGHVRDVWSLGDADGRAVFAATLKIARAVGDLLRPDGLNIIQSNGEVATQTIPHLHVHVLPRYKEDSMELGWPDDSGFPEAAVESAWRALAEELK